MKRHEALRLAAFLRLPAGVARVGSEMGELEGAAREWSDRIGVPESELRDWFLKEAPAHDIPVSEILMMRYPLTAGLAGGRGGNAGDLPVIVPAARDADRIAASLRLSTGLPFRLPSEAEWEWAARGTSRCQYPWGDRFDPARCNTMESNVAGRTAVTSHPTGRSPNGVEDLAGNVEEWTASDYRPHPGGTAVEDDIARSHPDGYRITKGGSYQGHGDLARVARRHGPMDGFTAYGVRLVVDARATNPESAAEALVSWGFGRRG